LLLVREHEEHGRRDVGQRSSGTCRHTASLWRWGLLLAD
jgi:hypothetical protein